MFIGRFDEPSEIEAALDACLLNDEELAMEKWTFEGHDQLPWQKSPEDDHDHDHDHAHGHSHHPAPAA